VSSAVLCFVDLSEPPHLMAANAIETELLANCGYTTVSEPGNLVTPATGGQPGSLINRVAPGATAEAAALMRRTASARLHQQIVCPPLSQNSAA